MQPTWEILRATQHCHYKVWQITRDLSKQSQDLNLTDDFYLELPIRKITPNDKIAAAAWYFLKMQSAERKATTIKILSSYSFTGNVQTITINPEKYLKHIQKLLAELKDVIEKKGAPAFYRNNHCPECQFKDTCYQKLKERDCLSLLGGMSPNILAKYHKKGITTITQLSHIFRPKRRMAKTVGNYLYELKALAIREQKTYVIKPPDLKENTTNIYLDFEGLPEQHSEYLLGVIIKEENKADSVFSFWADNESEEEKKFSHLLDLLNNYPEATIYHYGSYELTALKQAAKKWKGDFQKALPGLQKRMINLLSFLRSHVYPPVYKNGLKDVAGFLGFKWSDNEADGLRSIEWRNKWMATGDNSWKEKLIQYNIDDCNALIKVHEWFWQLTVNADSQKNVEQISKLNRYSPYRLQRNVFTEDYDYINKGAYFDYQRTKIYWRNKKGEGAPKNDKHHVGRGKRVWKPKRVNEVVQLPLLKNCPHCGSERLYHLSRKRTYIQTDLKFTVSGIKQWTVEYVASCGKCAKCLKKYNDSIVRNLYVGDNLLAWAVNLYVTYHVSFSMISRRLREQFGIWTNATYFNDRIYGWWERFKPDVDYCWRIIFNSPVIHIDETTVRLSRGQDKGYVWVFTTKHTVFYHLTITREAGYLLEWLKDYKGVIVTDFFPGYDSLPVKRQKCLVHLIRDLNDDLLKNPFDEEYKKIVVAFGELLKKIIVTVDKYGLKHRHLKKHFKEINIFYEKFLNVEHTSELSIRYAKRFKRHWNETWEFLHHDGVPWNNNNAEVAIKAFAHHRRGVNGQMSENGLRPYLSMLTIAQTCRYRDISFLDYVRGKTGIWKNIHPDDLPGILPFKQARLFVQQQKIHSIAKLKEWEKAKRPAFIPDDPAFVYRNDGWKSWKDWIGGD